MTSDLSKHFIIIGCRRSGTSSLYHWMECHPDIYLHPDKDTEFFMDDALAGRTSWLDGDVDLQLWQETHTPEMYFDRFSGAPNQTIRGEKCADILNWKASHKRIAEYLPDGRFIAILRNPIDRTWSHYWHNVGRGRETLSFEDAIQNEEDRCATSDYAKYHLTYKQHSHYADNLLKLWEQVNREQVLVLILEEALANPVVSLKRVYEFLDIDSSVGLEKAGKQYNQNFTMTTRQWAQLPGIKIIDQVYHNSLNRMIKKITKNQSALQRKYTSRKIRRIVGQPFRKIAVNEPMNPETQIMLREHFKPHNGALEELLGQPIPEWKP